jgi:Ca-activated chloride channel homolog
MPLFLPRRRVCSLILGALVLGGCAGQPAAVISTPPKDPPPPEPIPGEPPRLVELTTSLDRRALAADQPGRVLARVRVAAGTPTRQRRPPIELALVIDTSGSMEGQPIEDARQAALALLDALHDGDRLIVVTFDARAELLVAPTVLDAKAIAAARAAMLGIQARGTTDLAGGLELALAQLAATTDPAPMRRIVLLSDGVPNDASTIAGLAERARASAISITALGFGLEYDETLLAQLAQHSGGRFHRIADDERIATAFTDEVLRLDQAIAGNLVLALRTGPGVQLLGVVGHPELVAGSSSASLTLADLSEGQAQELYLELASLGHHDGVRVELLDVRLDYDERTRQAGRLQREAFVSLPSTTAREEIDARDPELERGGARASAAAATLDAIARARAGDFAGAVAVLDQALDTAKRAAKRLDDAELRDHVAALARLRKTLGIEAKRQALALRRMAADAAKASHGAPGTVPSVHAPEPMAARELATIKQSHAAAFDALQAR